MHPVSDNVPAHAHMQMHVCACHVPDNLIKCVQPPGICLPQGTWGHCSLVYKSLLKKRTYYCETCQVKDIHMFCDQLRVSVLYCHYSTSVCSDYLEQLSVLWWHKLRSFISACFYKKLIVVINTTYFILTLCVWSLCTLPWKSILASIICPYFWLANRYQYSRHCPYSLKRSKLVPWSVNLGMLFSKDFLP